MRSTELLPHIYPLRPCLPCLHVAPGGHMPYGWVIFHFCHLGVIYGQLSPMAWLVGVPPWDFRVRGTCEGCGGISNPPPSSPLGQLGVSHPGRVPCIVLARVPHCLPTHGPGIYGLPEIYPHGVPWCPRLSRRRNATGKVWLA